LQMVYCFENILWSMCNGGVWWTWPTLRLWNTCNGRAWWTKTTSKSNWPNLLNKIICYFSTWIFFPFFSFVVFLSLLVKMETTIT
jgi:hypothetical protein